MLESQCHVLINGAYLPTVYLAFKLFLLGTKDIVIAKAEIFILVIIIMTKMCVCSGSDTLQVKEQKLFFFFLMIPVLMLISILKGKKSQLVALYWLKNILQSSISFVVVVQLLNHV